MTFPEKNINRTKVYSLLIGGLYLSLLIIALWNAYMDDAYIGFRYVYNLIHGNGMVFNIGERVEGVTNIGWLFPLALLSLLFKIPIAAKLISIFCIVLSIYAGLKIYKLYSEQENSTYFSLTALMMLTQFEFVYFSLIGMETAFFALILCFLVLLADKEHILTPVVYAYAFLVRPECILIFPLFVIFCFMTDLKSAKKQIKPFGIFVFLILIITLIRYIYYGDLLPNTFYTKSPGIEYYIERFKNLHNSHFSNIAYPFYFFSVFFTIIYGLHDLYLRHKLAALQLSAILFTGYFFCIYSRNDWTGIGRYFAPYTIIAFVVFSMGLKKLIERLFISNFSSDFISAIPKLIILGIIAYQIFLTLFFLNPQKKFQYPWFVMNSENLKEAALWIKHNTKKDAVIATKRIGAVAFISQRYIFDYKFGLPNKSIARLLRKNKKPFSYPDDKNIASEWNRIKPDYLLEDNIIIAKYIKENHGKDIFKINDNFYKIINVFRLNPEREWVLCKRLEEASPP